MLRAWCAGLLLGGSACGTAGSADRPAPPPEPSAPRAPKAAAPPAPTAPPDPAAGVEPEDGLIGAGALTTSGVLLAIDDDPPGLWQRTAGGVQRWPAPARIGALAAGPQPGELIVAAAWAEARRPRAEIWWLTDGRARRHCIWEAPPLERWRAQPRGATDVRVLADGAVVAGADGSLVRFDASCIATTLHAEPCCEAERPLRLRGDARAWSAVDAAGGRVYPAGTTAATCTPAVDGADLRAGPWRTPLPAGASAARALDWSDACDLVLVAAGTAAWTCRADGCTRVR